jgi:HAD superfamily hydrolase (TIGR01490 family)
MRAVPATRPSRAIAVLDLDNTIVRGSAVFHFGRGAVSRGLIAARDVWSFAWQQFRFAHHGENTGKLRDIQDRALGIAAGRRLDEITALMPDIYDRWIAPCVWPHIPDIIAMHREAGREVWIATASPRVIAAYIAERLGCTGAIASDLELTPDGRLTGRFSGPVRHGQSKADAVAALARERDLDLAASFAYTDSINDEALLRLVGNPVAVNPDTRLRRLAGHEGWPVLRLRRR